MTATVSLPDDAAARTGGDREDDTAARTEGDREDDTAARTEGDREDDTAARTEGDREDDTAARTEGDREDDTEADPVTMDTTAGRVVRYLRVATFSFELEREDDDLTDGTFDLHAYQQRPGSDEPLFVPFRDKTTGQQTYEGGRYMELAPERDLEDGDEIVLDFNLAYSPFCAYSETFDCPLPPEENWLDVAIPAGEKVE
ncbi:DUF1684 domain-containing protein [Salinilacihabitans rarus]|uniref:DUF1684 domain-containing protein n=1 Tax=Salinilacihabitans rarus TaxID=2961596 RepID=UPI003CCD41FC